MAQPNASNVSSIPSSIFFPCVSLALSKFKNIILRWCYRDTTRHCHPIQRYRQIHVYPIEITAWIFEPHNKCQRQRRIHINLLKHDVWVIKRFQPNHRHSLAFFFVTWIYNANNFRYAISRRVLLLFRFDGSVLGDGGKLNKRRNHGKTRSIWDNKRKEYGNIYLNFSAPTMLTDIMHRLSRQIDFPFDEKHIKDNAPHIWMELYQKNVFSAAMCVIRVIRLKCPSSMCQCVMRKCSPLIFLWPLSNA